MIIGILLDTGRKGGGNSGIACDAKTFLI